MSNFDDAVQRQREVEAYWRAVLEQLIRKLGIPVAESIIAKLRAEVAHRN